MRNSQEMLASRDLQLTWLESSHSFWGSTLHSSWLMMKRLFVFLFLIPFVKYHLSVWQWDFSWALEWDAGGGDGWHCWLLYCWYINNLCKSCSFFIQHALAQPWHLNPLHQTQGSTPITVGILGPFFHRCEQLLVIEYDMNNQILIVRYTSIHFWCLSWSPLSSTCWPGFPPTSGRSQTTVWSSQRNMSISLTFLIPSGLHWVLSCNKDQMWLLQLYVSGKIYLWLFSKKESVAPSWFDYWTKVNN